MFKLNVCCVTAVATVYNVQLNTSTELGFIVVNYKVKWVLRARGPIFSRGLSICTFYKHTNGII